MTYPTETPRGSALSTARPDVPQGRSPEPYTQMAAIVITKERLLHLAVLVGCSSAFALLLMYVMGWSRMAAWGLAVTTVCQVNKVVVDERDKRAKAEEKALQRSERKETEGSTKKKH